MILFQSSFISPLPLFSSDEMKDDYLTKRFCDAQQAADIVAHYKRLPTLQILARQPFVCWMVATVFERCYRYQGYGVHPPRLTPFYVSILIVQTNRRLQFYYGKADNDLVLCIYFFLTSTKIKNYRCRGLQIFSVNIPFSVSNIV